eukprot:CAMPEP_0172556316 /NCGR_PEP_ID=MMETSP1067-20121228/65443_1 /TAXON_ID=265564 ORGANISM="Thalassiosira punctigera, Strain Tpunct2005C2" /NCGR_SAMPLE_ID=MMETSP1067 /ASSEMBLY_ACC=CAM_ASM_000444 /LENGTH=138 /DNA_ID=CAMNT_0013345101 /DNA_START=29 /DNA_END=442 /DNA_ORIENTATION=+
MTRTNGTHMASTFSTLTAFSPSMHSPTSSNMSFISFSDIASLAPMFSNSVRNSSVVMTPSWLASTAFNILPMKRAGVSCSKLASLYEYRIPSNFFRGGLRESTSSSADLPPVSTLLNERKSIMRCGTDIAGGDFVAGG